ncbi:hypothetical protein BDW59DRAFT_143602 [Aspergillus cavernicola]|uniref:Uncharacterized protein n=1 Tax=Aspergillus cavernicola TaxID=176166 RepID=A0ABR4IJL7_9EURO
MASKASNLSDPRCQCDFVVATTQDSINSGLLEHLDKVAQPVQYVCVLRNERYKTHPTVQVSLEELLQETGGVNPFEMPDDLDEMDPRVLALDNARFYMGVMLQIGIPPGHTPQTLPPIITFNSANNVSFNLFCRQLTLVSLEPSFCSTNFWVYTQPEAPAKPWSMTLSVNLTTAALDRELDTPYLNSHPEIKSHLRNAIENLSRTAFSLQQLYLDLDNAVMETVPEFSGVVDPGDKDFLESHFRSLYSKSAKEQGLPLVAVTAVAKPEEMSTLHMTGFERIVNPLKDGNGMPIQSPIPEEKDATTLDYLCAVNGHAVPRISSLDWNWMEPEDVNDSSGVIAINRNILANFIASNCNLADLSYAPSVESDTIYLGTATGMQTPSPTASGNRVIEWKHQGCDEGLQDLSSEAINKIYKVFTKVVVDTSLDVYFEEQSIRVVQSSLINVTCALADNHGNIIGPNQNSINAVNKTLTNIYSMSVSQSGALQLVKADEKSDDRSEPIPASEGDVNLDDPVSILRAAFSHLLEGAVSERLEKAQKDLDRAGGGLHELPLSNLQNFVFPSARVFTYKDPFFSDYQDLVCKITYLDPSKVSPQQPPKQPL